MIEGTCTIFSHLVCILFHGFGIFPSVPCIFLHHNGQKFIVEQHKDNLQKAHIYFYSPIPFPKKGSDSVLGLEVKGLGEHGIAYCANSTHKDGQPYEITGTTSPITLTADQANEYIEHIDQICKKYNLEYLEKHYRNLFDSDAKIHQGERHRSLISIANSLLFRYVMEMGMEARLWIRSSNRN